MINIQALGRAGLVAALIGAAAWGVGGCRNSETEGGNTTANTPSPPGGGGGEILVGEYGSMTGDQSTFGISTDEGIQLAVEEINAAGGVNGRKIKIVGPED